MGRMHQALQSPRRKFAQSGPPICIAREQSLSGSAAGMVIAFLRLQFVPPNLPRRNPMVLKVVVTATAAALLALAGVAAAQSTDSSKSSGSAAGGATSSPSPSSSSPSAASPSSSSSSASGGATGGSSAPSFSAVDKNSDGSISRAEWDAYFNKSDKSGSSSSP